MLSSFHCKAIKVIAGIVAKEYNIETAIIFERCRIREISFPRGIVWAIAKELYWNLHPTDLGFEVGRYSRCNVIHFINLVKDQRRLNKKFDSQYMSLIKACREKINIQ